MAWAPTPAMAAERVRARRGARVLVWRWRRAARRPPGPHRTPGRRARRGRPRRPPGDRAPRRTAAAPSGEGGVLRAGSGRSARARSGRSPWRSAAAASAIRAEASPGSAPSSSAACSRARPAAPARRRATPPRRPGIARWSARRSCPREVPGAERRVHAGERGELHAGAASPISGERDGARAPRPRRRARVAAPAREIEERTPRLDGRGAADGGGAESAARLVGAPGSLQDLGAHQRRVEIVGIEGERRARRRRSRRAPAPCASRQRARSR